MLRDRSFAELDLQDVARLARTTRRAIFNQFESKGDLYRSSREELVFELSRAIADSVPERMEPIDGMRFMAELANEVFKHPANQEVNHSIIRDGRRFPWLPLLYDRHVVTPLIQTCEVYILRVTSRDTLPAGQARAIAEQFLITVDAMSSDSGFIRQRSSSLATSTAHQLDIAAQAFGTTIARHLAVQ